MELRVKDVFVRTMWLFYPPRFFLALGFRWFAIRGFGDSYDARDGKLVNYP